MHLSLNAVACAMRTKNSGVQGRRARSARYTSAPGIYIVKTAIFLINQDTTRLPAFLEYLAYEQLVLRYGNESRHQGSA